VFSVSSNPPYLGSRSSTKKQSVLFLDNPHEFV
jgi:hypothetical protein